MSGLTQYKATLIGRGVTLKTPTSVGSSGQSIVSDGAGNLSFATVATTPAGVGTEVQYRNGSSFGAITGSSYATGVVTLPTLAVTDLTATRIPYVGTAGRLVDTNDLLWDPSTEQLKINYANANPGSTYDLFLGYGLQIGAQAGYKYTIMRNGSTGLLEIFGGQTGCIGILTKEQLGVQLSSGQSADAIQVTSYGGTAGDLFKIDSAGKGWFGGDAIESYGGYWELNNSKMIVHGTMQYVWCTPSYNTQSASYSLGLEQVSSGVLGVNNGTAGQWRDLKARNAILTGTDVGSGLLLPYSSEGNIGNIFVNGVAGLDIFNTRTLGSGDVRLASYSGSIILATGLTATSRLTVASTGATTINAVSGNPLTVQANGTTAVSVASTGATTITPTSTNVPLTVTRATHSGYGRYISCTQGGVEEAFLSTGLVDGYGGYLQLGLSPSSYTVLSHNLGFPLLSTSQSTFQIQTSNSSIVLGSSYGTFALNGTWTFATDVGATVFTSIVAASAKFQRTTEQLRLGYNSTNYVSWTVASNGDTTAAITTGTTTNGFVFSNPVSCPGAGTANSERFGSGAVSAAYANSFGLNATAGGTESIAIGYASYVTGIASIGIGQVNNTYASTIAIGRGCTPTSDNQFMIGSTLNPINAMKLITDAVGGSLNFGVTSGNLTITPSGGATTNIGNFYVTPVSTASQFAMSVSGSYLALQAPQLMIYSNTADLCFQTYAASGTQSYKFFIGSNALATFSSNSGAPYTKLSLQSFTAGNFSEPYLTVTSNGGSTGDILTLTSAGKLGVLTAAPDKQVEINSATGDCLRLTYNDSNGTAAYCADFAVSAAGSLTITPTGPLTTIASIVATSGRRKKYVSKTADYTAVASDEVIYVDDSGANRTITLPAVATVDGMILSIVKTTGGANKVIIDGNGSETINGSVTQELLLQYETIQIQATSSGWNIL